MASALETIAPGFLVASPALQDPNFDRTVVLMCVHNEEGAMGLVINRPSPLNIRDIMIQLDLSCTTEISQAAMVGGPVALESGLLLYQTDESSEQRDDELLVTKQLRLCPNRDLLEAIGQGDGPNLFHMFLGHSGWGPSQLEHEISQGVWIPTRLRLELIFEIPLENRWEEALLADGLHPAQLSSFRPMS